MQKTQLTDTFLDQSKDLYWIVGSDFKLLNANKAYQCFMKEATGVEKVPDESALIEVFGKADMKKWKAFYTKALRGERFEIESHFYNEKTKETEYNQVTFEPLKGKDRKVFAVACQSRDITRIVKRKSEVNQLIDASLDVFCTINPEGDFIHISAAAFDHWGYHPEELIGKSWRDLVLEEDLAKTKETVSEIVGGRQVKTFANRYKRKDGGIAYNLWSARYDERTKLRYAVARDNKEQVEQEEKILRSEQRFKALVSGAFDLVAVLDTAGRYLYMSPSIEAISGIPPEEFIGKNAFDFVHPDDVKQTEADLKTSMKVPRVNMKPYRAKNHQNEWRWVESVLTNMLDNSAINGIVINSRDVTDKVEQEEKIIQTEKRFETLIENSTDCITIISPEGETIYISQAIKNILGYTPSETLEMDIWELIHTEDVEGVKAAIAEAMENPGVSIKGHTSRIKHKDGTWRWIDAVITNLIDDPSIGGIVDVISDVTKQKTDELEKDLINEIKRIFNQQADNDLTDILSEVCGLIGRFGNFSFAEMWLPTFDNEKINRTANYTGSKAGKTFFKESEKLDSLEVEEGLSGQVFKNRETVIWEVADDEWHLFKRKSAAEKAGIESLIAIPLLHNDKLFGGLLVGTEKSKTSLSENVELFQKLESTIGSELSRKKTEVELSQIFNFTPDMICVVGFDGYIKRINPAGLALLGYSSEEILSRPLKSFVHEEDRWLTEGNLSKLYGGENIDNFENRYISKEGNVVWLSWTATSLTEQGIIYAAAKDVTEEKKLKELNRQVGELAKIGSWEIDLINDTLYWSDQVHRIHGTEPTSFTPTLEGAVYFYREDFREMVSKKVEKCIAEQEPYDFEAVIVTADKKEKWIRANGNAEYVDGVCIRIYGSFQDISERKESEDRLESFADNLPGVAYQYITGPEGNDSLSYVSKGANEIWGHTAKEVQDNMDLAWDRIKAGGEMDKVQASIARSIETKAKWTCKYKYMLPSGELRTHLGYGVPHFLSDGTVLFNSIALDITQEAKNEELLKEITKIARIGSWEMELVDQDSDQMYWSAMLREIVEVDDSYDPTLSGGVEFHVGESKDRIRNALNALITDGVEFDEEILLRTATGRERWSRAIGKSETVNGTRVRIYGSYQDIHEQKVADLELKKSLKSLKDYKYSLDQSAIIAFTDKHGVITSVNDNFCKISGYGRDELVGKTHQLINADYHSPAFFVDLWKTISSGKVWRGEVKNKAKDGSYYWVDTTIVPFLDEKNRPLQYLAIRFDITERKMAEQERNRLQATIENSLNEIYTFDEETYVFTYANQGALQNLGYTLQELKTFTPMEIKPHYTPSSFEKLVTPLINNEKGKIIFFTDHKRKDGSLYPVEVHLQLVAEGNTKRFLAVVLDITERIESHQHLLQANERFEKVTEATHDAIWDWDIAEERFYRSKAIERFFGKGTSQLFTEDHFWTDAFHPKDLPVIQKSLKDALADPSKDRWKQEYRVFNKKGETVHVIDRGVIVRNEEGKAIRMAGAMTDITQQKKSDEDNRFKASLLSMIGQAAIATDLEGEVSYWNAAAETIYGWKQEEALGMNILDLTPMDTNREQAVQIMETLKDGHTWAGEFNVQRKDGTNFPIRVSNSPIYDENNSLSGIIGISSDISEEVEKEKLLKQYTRDLERSNEELEQFAFVASHDLQEPLRMVSSFMNLLERKYEDRLDDKALQYIHFATDGAKRMKQIILDLLDYSRANKPTDGKVKVDMNEVLSEFKQLRRKLISEKSASIQSDHLPTLHTHKAAVTQVLHCLLDNALKYSEQGVEPEIQIGAEEKENEWVFSVKDNGIGIDPQFYEKIFVIFQRLHNKGKYAGTGIGLSIAKRHIEFLGGQITLDSTVGKGSTFYFSIPK